MHLGARVVSASNSGSQGHRLRWRQNSASDCMVLHCTEPFSIILRSSRYDLNKYSADDKLVIFFLFFPKTGFDISCKLSPMETICMKCQNLFSGKNKKNISKCRLLKILPRVLSVKTPNHYHFHLG